jgi:hypothetical protein
MAQPADPFSIHPSAFRDAYNPFAAVARTAAGREALKVSDDAPPGTYTYSLLKSGPDVSPEEAELAGTDCLEVMVSWGANVLHVAHLSPPRSFYLGERTSENAPIDFFVPAEVLGEDRRPLVIVRGAELGLVVPSGARGYLEGAGRRVVLEAASAGAPPCAEVAGARVVDLPLGGSARLEIGQFVFFVARGNAGKPTPRSIAGFADRAAATSFAISLFASAFMVAAAAFFVPDLGLSDDGEIDQDRLRVIQQYLRASAERDRENSPDPTSPEAQQDSEGGTGTRAKNEEGKMGRHDARPASKRWAAQGPESNRDVQLAKQMTVAEAREFGLIGLLKNGAAGDPNAPTVPWGGDHTLGNDPISAMGNMWGGELGDAPGGGLGLTGIGEGGGGYGEGIGVGTIGPYGHGSGLGLGQGFGNSAGRLSRGHATKGPQPPRESETKLSGRLPPEVIQRVVRQNFGRFRHCYDQALTRNPNLQGRVAARFVIDRSGAVSNVTNGGSDLPDSNVVSCVLGAFYGLNFPSPEGGIVTVVYPIAFSPG